MKALISKLALAAAIYPVTTIAASAQMQSWRDLWNIRTQSTGSSGGGSTSSGSWSGGSVTQTSGSVPEIDASTGLLALAAVGAALMLAWEIKRRRQRA